MSNTPVVSDELTHHRQLKKDRAEQDIIDTYIKTYGTDPTPILETEYMSEEISQLDTDDEVKKKAHRARLVEKAGLKDSDAEDGVVVWEVVRKAWRSDDVSSTDKYT